ncbi:MAG: NAD(P)-binding domain-containing protein [Deltaproteobacteria bacterium]|nr:NAD(P)-binding domain-containing protein [Deltaproteobacteria bacterium]
MKIAILGTGMVGRTLAERLAGLGHDVQIGTRSPQETMARTSPDPNMGTPGFATWHKDHANVKLVRFEEAARHGELVMNATAGRATIEILSGIGQEALAGKTLIDISNSLDFSKGMPPTLLVSNTDSLGEAVQRLLPKTRVVKTLNTVNAELMVRPASLAKGEHTLFLCGDDEGAKAQVRTLLCEGFGWTDVIDLGGMRAARGTEMYLPLWISLWGALKTPSFSIRVVR